MQSFNKHTALVNGSGVGTGNVAYGGPDHLHEAIMRDGCGLWVCNLQVGIRAAGDNAELALDDFAAVHLSLRIPFLLLTSENAFFLNRLKRHVPILVKSRSGIELQATEDIEVFRSAKVSVSSVISTKEHGGDASQTGFPNPRLSHQLKAVIQ